MPVNLLEMLTSSVGKEIVGLASKKLGETEASTGAALDSLLPALLGGLMTKAATPQGAADLYKTVNGADIDTGLLGNLGAALSGGARTDSLMSAGSTLASTLLGGNRVGGLVDALASAVGIKPASASGLLAMVVPLLMSFLKKTSADKGLDATGFADLLLGQKSFLQQAKVDPAITKALGFDSLSGMLGSLPSTLSAVAGAVTGAGAAAASAAKTAGTAAADAARSAGSAAADAASSAASAGASGFRRWVPWIIVAVVLLLLWQFLGRT